jgi:glucose-6-phosphate isomerase
VKIHLAPEIDSVTVPADLLEISQRIADLDATIWGEESEAATRLGWVNLPESSRTLLPQLDALSASAREKRVKKIILSGMGGSSLAPEVVAKSFKGSVQRELIILDSTEPHFVSSIAEQDLSDAMILISSKSGTTIETRSHLDLILASLSSQGLDARDHIIVVTDPGSPLVDIAEDHGWRLILGDPHVGGRFSALSAFGLVPAALLGLDASLLLDDAAEILPEIHIPAIKLALYLAPHRYLYFYDSLDRLPGLADWIEQLIAESTGKGGKGLLPIAVDQLPDTNDLPVIDLATSVDAPLGAQFILWEWVTALLGYIYRVDPFDQPDVQATKVRTIEALHEKTGEIHPEGLVSITEVDSALRSALHGREYLAICAYLDPIADHEVKLLQRSLQKRYQVPVSFGWGPRFLHSTGQFHKGGPKSGIFLSITMRSEMQIKVPGEEYGFEDLILAQAEGDRRALVESGSPVIRVELRDKEELGLLLENLRD